MDQLRERIDRALRFTPDRIYPIITNLNFRPYFVSYGAFVYKKEQFDEAGKKVTQFIFVDLTCGEQRELFDNAHLAGLLEEKTGQHFSTFLTRTRMEKAQELLAESSGRTLADISASCGYPNKSYFCQVFKKYTGMTPGEYEQRRLDGNA